MEEEWGGSFPGDLGDMKKLDPIRKKIREKMPELQSEYHVRNLEIFGSYLRGEQKKRSDLDILVEFEETVDLFKFMELEAFLSKLLGVKVDLVMKETLKSRIKERILKEAIPV